MNLQLLKRNHPHCIGDVGHRPVSDCAADKSTALRIANWPLVDMCPHGIRKILLILLSIIGVATNSSYGATLKFIDSTPTTGSQISSFDEVILNFDLSEIVAEYGDEANWGIRWDALYDEAFIDFFPPQCATLYKGRKEDNIVVGRLAESLYINSVDWSPGNTAKISFANVQVETGQLYTLEITYDFSAVNKNQPNVNMHLDCTYNPITLTFVGGSHVIKVLNCESNSVEENAKFEAINESIKLTFNYDVEVLSGASATVTENNVTVATATSLTVDPADSKSVLISFPETPLYNGHKYTLNVPAGIIGVAGETDVTNSEISASFEGATFRSFGIGRVFPSNNSTAILDKIIVPFKFPVIEGSEWSYGFVNIEKLEYPMSVYKGTEEDGELVATVNGSPDNASLTFNLTGLEPGTQYTCVIAEGTVKAYAIGDPRNSYLKDYISEKVVLTYTTPSLDQLGSLTIGCKDIKDNDVVEHLGAVSFTCSGAEYGNTVYQIFVVDNSGNYLPGVVYEITPQGDKEVCRFTFSRYAVDDLVAQINTDLYEGRNYRVVIPAKVLKIYNSDFLGRYVFNEELSVNLVGAKSTESASEFTSGIVEGQKLSHVGVVSFYTDGDVSATENAVLELRKGEETVVSAPVRVAKEEGYSHVYADFSGETHKPFATENGTTYTAVLPKGAVVETANENLLNKEQSVSFTGMASESVCHNVTLSLANAVAQTSAVEEGKTVSFVLTPADELWKVESVSNATLEAESGKYVTEPVNADIEVKAVFALVNPVDFDFTEGVDATVAGCPYSVYSENGRLVIEGVAEGDNIRIYTTGGALMAERVVPSKADTVSIDLSAGIYIVAINSKTLKVKH